MFRRRFLHVVLLLTLVILLLSGVSIVRSDYADDAISRIQLQLDKLFSKVEAMDKSSKGYASLTAHRLPTNVTICGETVPLDNPMIRERLEHEFYMSLTRQGQTLYWFKRAGRYFPEIESELRAKGLPTDLKYVAVAESDLKPHAVSHAGAVGLWQFIAPTGKTFGLTVTKTIDDRRDVRASTQAAMKYLRVLHDSLGSWPLAMAGYNAGGTRVKNELERQGVDNYYQLDLPLETERYVYRIISAKIILENGERYGYNIPKKDIYKPIVHDEVVVNLTKDTSFVTLAKASGSYYRLLKELNPRYRTTYVPKGTRKINLPAGTRLAFLKNFEQ